MDAIDSVYQSLADDRRLRHFDQKAYEFRMQKERSMNVRRVIKAVEKHLSEAGNIRMDYVVRFIDSCEKYPEVRAYARGMYERAWYAWFKHGMKRTPHRTPARLKAVNRLRQHWLDFEQEKSAEQSADAQAVAVG